MEQRCDASLAVSGTPNKWGVEVQQSLKNGPLMSASHHGKKILTAVTHLLSSLFSSDLTAAISRMDVMEP